MDVKKAEVDVEVVAMETEDGQHIAQEDDADTVVHQFPLRPVELPLNLTGNKALTAHFKMDSEKLKLGIPLDTNSDVYDKAKGKRIAEKSVVQNKKGKPEESPEFESIMSHHTFTSSKAGGHIGNSYALGILRNGPSRSTGQAEGGESSQEESETEQNTAQTVRVKFSRESTAEALRRTRRQRGLNLDNDDDEPWIPLAHHPSHEEKSVEERLSLLSTSTHSPPFPHKDRDKRQILRLFVPEGWEETSGQGALPTNTISLSDLRNLPLMDQVTALMTNAKVLAFHELGSFLQVPMSDVGQEARVLESIGKVASLVQGYWVVNSDFIYKQGSASEKTGMSGEILRKARDFVLHRMQRGEMVTRKEVSEAVKVDNEDILDILKEVGSFRRYKGWEFKYPPDTDFIESHPEMVKREKDKWMEKWAELRESMTIVDHPKRVRTQSGNQSRSPHRRRTGSGHSVSISSDQDIKSPECSGTQLTQPRRRRHSSKSEQIAENGSAMAPNIKSEPLSDSVAEELRSFVYQKLCDHLVLNASTLKQLLVLKRTESGPSYPLSSVEISDSQLETTAQSIGAVIVKNKATSSDPIYIFGDRGSFPKIRKFLVHFLQSRNSFRFATFRKACAAQNTEVPSDDDLKNIINDYCVCKGGVYSLRTMSEVPHRAITDHTEIVVTPRSLASELMCPICLDMLSNTMTTKECLHRFCCTCITTALRSGNKECPTCRKKLVSKRSLRPDPNFDALIAKIYPNRDEYEAMQQRAFQRLSKHTNTEAFQKSMEECLKHQAQLRRKQKLNPADFEYKKRTRKMKEKRETSEGNGNGEEETGMGTGEWAGERERESSLEPSISDASDASPAIPHPQEVELILRPHPDLENSSANAPLKQTRYLKTTGNATVDHISKYVAMRVHLDEEEASRREKSPEVVPPSPLPSPHDSPLTNGNTPATPTYRIFVNPGIGSNKQYTPLDGSMTLSEVRSRFWKVKRPLELQFKIESPPFNTNDQSQQSHTALNSITNHNPADFTMPTVNESRTVVKTEDTTTTMTSEQPFDRH